LPSNAFLYLGYLPRKSAQRRRAIKEVAALPYTLIILATPHRLLKTLGDLQAMLGDRVIAVARELTKLHEEIFRGSIGDAIGHFEAQNPRGEITLVVAGASDQHEMWPRERLRAEAKAALAEGEKPPSISRHLADKAGWPRREVYNLVVELQNQSRNT
jgi:16S rRNA (cytidine1402-2'-O)-methyltransferase